MSIYTRTCGRYEEIINILIKLLDFAKKVLLCTKIYDTINLRHKMIKCTADSGFKLEVYYGRFTR